MGFVIACVGVGNMGGAVARNLARSGFAVTVYDPDPAAMERCQGAGASAAGSIDEACRDAEVVLTSLPTPKVLVDTAAKIVRAVRRGCALVDISTVDPATAREVSDVCLAAGVSFLACPLGKSPQHAEIGEIPLFVGGPSHVIQRLRPLLEAMGNSIHELGSIESATIVKLVSNLIGMTNVAVLAEGFVLARRAGVAAEAFHRALKETGAASFQEEVRLPWMIEEDWSARFAIDLALKDLTLAIESADRLDVPVPVGSAALAQFTAASSAGFGGDDVAALVRIVGGSDHRDFFPQ